jgi:hypothetical protein
VYTGILTLLLSMALFGLVVANHSETSYDGDEDGGDDTLSTMQSQTPGLKIMIVRGAGCFLESNAYFQHFLQRVETAELNGADHAEWRSLLEHAVTGLESAGVTYRQLKNRAAGLPYNPGVIFNLLVFDYRGFRSKNGLNKTVFSRVEYFLSRGNVTGVYGEISARTDELLELLRVVKKSVDSDTLPPIRQLWKINQLYFDTLLFGQYVAMVFNTVKN